MNDNELKAILRAVIESSKVQLEKQSLILHFLATETPHLEEAAREKLRDSAAENGKHFEVLNEALKKLG